MENLYNRFFDQMVSRLRVIKDIDSIKPSFLFSPVEVVPGLCFGKKKRLSSMFGNTSQPTEFITVNMYKDYSIRVSGYNPLIIELKYADITIDIMDPKKRHYMMGLFYYNCIELMKDHEEMYYVTKRMFEKTVKDWM